MSLERGSMEPRRNARGRQRDSHVPTLDGLRGLAIIMVLFVHFFVLFLTVVSYEWFEKRFLRLKRWFGEGAPVTGELSVKAAPLS